jgi:hypothetical protein
MNKYEWGPRTLYAWSEMQCRKSDNHEDHTPHTWNAEYTLYGPYMCWGEPFRLEPFEDDIRMFVGAALKGLDWMIPYMQEGSQERKAIKALEEFADGR